MKRKEGLDFYLQHRSMFRKDFWYFGNTELQISIERRSDVESGEWFVATFVDRFGEKHYVTSQWEKLLWERLIKAHLSQDFYERRVMVEPGGEAEVVWELDHDLTLESISFTHNRRDEIAIVSLTKGGDKILHTDIQTKLTLLLPAKVPLRIVLKNQGRRQQVGITLHPKKESTA